MKLPLKTLIVEDKNYSLRRLRNMLEPFPEFISIDAVAKTYEEAITLLKYEKKEFQLSILDVNLAGKSCYQLIREIGFDAFGIITFNTVVKEVPFDIAGQIGHIHCLKKPYSEIDTRAFLDKLKNDSRISGGDLTITVPILVNQHVNINLIDKNTQNVSKSYLHIRHDGVNTRIPMNEIYFIHSQGPYSDIYYKDNNGEAKCLGLVRELLGLIFDRLDHSHFERCHKSYVVNTQHIRGCKPDHEEGYLYFTNEKSTGFFKSGSAGLQANVRYGKEFRDWLYAHKFLDRP